MYLSSINHALLISGRFLSEPAAWITFAGVWLEPIVRCELLSASCTGFVISVHSQMEAKYLSVFLVGGVFLNSQEGGLLRKLLHDTADGPALCGCYDVACGCEHQGWMILMKPSSLYL